MLTGIILSSASSKRLNLYYVNQRLNGTVNENNTSLYQTLKESGLFYLALGSCISSDNDYTIEKCDTFISRLEGLLKEIPEEEHGDRKRVEECLIIVRKEKDKIHCKS